MTRASVTRRTVWDLMDHELIYEDSSSAWLRAKAESQNTTVLLPHRSGRSPNGPSIPQFYEAPGLEVDQYRHSIAPSRAVRSFPSYNTPLCEAPMPFRIRPYRRFPVQDSVTYNAVLLLKLPLASCSGFYKA